eukprot:4551647-Prymnesium_polylepis.1
MRALTALSCTAACAGVARGRVENGHEADQVRVHAANDVLVVLAVAAVARQWLRRRAHVG